MDIVMELGEERVAQILSKGYKHTFWFAHRFTLAAGVSPFTTDSPPFLFQVGQESWWVWTKVSAFAIPANSVGTGNPLESFQLQFQTTSSGRNHQSEPFTPILLGGTIGYPYLLPAKQFFPRNGNLQVVCRNLSTGINVVDVMCHGFRFYPDPDVEAVMTRAFAKLAGG